MLLLFQSLIIIAALLAVLGLYKRKKTGQLDNITGFFWLLFWLLVIIAAVWPNSTSLIAKFFGIGRGVDLVMYIAIAGLFYLVFRTQVKLEELNRNLTKLVRKDSLKNK